MSSQESLIILPKSNVINTTEKFENYQSIDTINYYHRGSNLLKLLQDIGAVVFDANNRLVLSAFFTNNEQKGSLSRILGYAAEGVVVRECNTNLSKNKIWANYARKLKQDSNAVMQFFKSIYYELFLENPDNYIAIGTGLAITKTEYSHIYSHNSDRDICWVNKYNDAKQLLTIGGIKWNKQNFVGIQLKVSAATNGYYVTNYFKNKPYYKLYPVVYFDLGGDFYQVKDNLIYIDSQTVKPNTLFSNEVNYGNYSHAEIVDMMLIRGKDVDPSLHDELLFYKDLLSQILAGKYSLYDLGNEDVLISLIIDYVGKNISSPSPILNIYV
ncbi:MAG: hypothetical protein ACBR12_26980 [Microcoleus sp.]